MPAEPALVVPGPPKTAAAPDERLTSPAPRERLTSVDALRGFIMVVMALDHVRDFTSSARFEPTDLAHTTVALFFTRWVTHFCAPAFMLLTGCGAYLSAKPRPALSRFLLSRGLWLVFVELTIVKVAWDFNFVVHDTHLQVIWCLGWSMVLLAALIWLPPAALLAFAALLIAGHDLFDGLPVGPLLVAGHYVPNARDWGLSILHVRNWPIVYPLVPWVAVMALGFALGPVLRSAAPRRHRALVGLGLSSCAAFLLVRGLDAYGDPSPWSLQASPLFTALSFLRVSKYPPSLDYLLMTLGPILLGLRAAEGLRGPVLGFFVRIGRVPFFFYVLHLYLIHALAIALGLAQGFPLDTLLVGWRGLPSRYGLPLAGVYALWLLVVALLTPVCFWFAGVKARRKDHWLSYL